ncbi:AMP-binding protein [Nocardia sp. NPDC055321]
MTVEFLDRLADITRNAPDAVAVDAHDAVWTYAELTARADHLASRLRAAGVGPGDVVALHIGRGAWHVAAILATWRVRAAFLPLEPDTPSARVSQILDESCCSAVLSIDIDHPESTLPGDDDPHGIDDAAGAAGLAGDDSSIARPNAHTLPTACATHREGPVIRAAGAPRAIRASGGPPRIALTPVDPSQPAAADESAYIIYTSGSTGRPKGVRVAHTGLVPMLTAQIAMFELAPGMRALFTLSTAFDASISDIGTALLSGATLVIPREPATPATLAELVRAHGVTHADLPPSLLAHVDPDSVPNTLRTIVIGGEVCAPAVVRAWAARVRLINVYGPTEATICTSMSHCGPEWTRPLLGNPLPHVEYALLDGELLIGGPALALGYVDRPELDRERFITRSGRRWYRTGDLVRHHPNGDWEFLGRADRQVKLNGRLVCPEEIEARLRDIPGITEAAVTTTDSPPALTAHIRTADPASTPASIHAHLSRSLPAWMLPQVTLVDALSRNSTGKVDHHALTHGARDAIAHDQPAPVIESPAASGPEPSTGRTSPNDTHATIAALERGRVVAESPTPRADTGLICPVSGIADARPGDGARHFDRELPTHRIALVCQAFAAALDITDVAPDNDFRQLGGDSLAALAVVTEARLRGVALDPAAVLTARTPARIAELPRPAHRTVADLNQLAARMITASAIDGSPRPARSSLSANELRHDAASGSHTGDWLVTGGTGFLGGHLIPELLHRTGATVHLLVRAPNTERARVRLGDLAAHPRIRVHAGDVAAPYLGLPRDTWHSLSNRVDGIIHGAAALSLSLPFSDLAAANIRGAAEIARFAAASNARVFHLSSLAVLASTDLDQPILDEHTRPPATAHLFGAYPQTKWAAETLLRTTVPHLSVIRPGLLTGHSGTGEAPANCPLTTFLRAVTTLGCLPDVDHDLLRVNITPVDQAAAAIAELATTTCPPLVHVASETGASLRDLRDAIGAHASIDTVAAAEFTTRTRERLTRTDALAMVTASYRLTSTDEHRDADLFLNTARRFPGAVLRAATGRTIAPPTPELLSRYTAFALDPARTARWSA